MAEIERKVQKIFAGGLSANGNIAKYGSKEAGTVGYSLDLDEIQTQRWLNGLAGSVSQDKAPYLQDLNAVFYTITKQLAYLFQAGIAEWNSETEYFANKSFVIYNGEMYRAIQNNTNQTPTNTTYWTKIVGLNMGIPEYNSSATYKKGQIVSYNYNDTSTILLKSLVDNNTFSPDLRPVGNTYQTRYMIEVMGVYASSSNLPASASNGQKALCLNDYTVYTRKSGSWVGTFNLNTFDADYITIEDSSTGNLYQFDSSEGSPNIINISNTKKWIVVNQFTTIDMFNNRICVYDNYSVIPNARIRIYTDGYIEILGSVQVNDGGNIDQYGYKTTQEIEFGTVLKDGYDINYSFYTPNSTPRIVSSITTKTKENIIISIESIARGSDIETDLGSLNYNIKGYLNIERN